MTTEECKIKKKSIPKVVKDHTWSKWIGDDIAKTKCMCCEITEIKMNNFHCGHVIAEVNGGLTSIENLRPICSACNLSMKTEDMDEFKKRCNFTKEINIEKYIPENNKESDYKKDFDMSAEKLKQNTFLYQRIKSKNIEVAKNLILDYDLSNSILKIIKNNCNDYTKLKKAIREHFINRENFIKNLCDKL